MGEKLSNILNFKKTAKNNISKKITSKNGRLSIFDNSLNTDADTFETRRFCLLSDKPNNS